MDGNNTWEKQRRRNADRGITIYDNEPEGKRKVLWNEGKRTMSEQTAQQINVYEYLGKEWDPLFNVICNIQQGCSAYLSEIKVTLTKNQYGLYEIISEFNHECYCNKKDLYDCVSKMLSNCL